MHQLLPAFALVEMHSLQIVMMMIELKLFTLSYTHEQSRANSCALESALTLTLVDNKHLAGIGFVPLERVRWKFAYVTLPQVPIASRFTAFFSAESSSLCGRLCARMLLGLFVWENLNVVYFFFAMALLLVAMMDRRYGYSQLMPVPRYGVGCRS